MDKIRVSAKTKSEAITKALIQLGTTSDRLECNVLSEGSTGLFGIGAKPWIIECSVKEIPDDIKKLESEIKNISYSSKPSAQTTQDQNKNQNPKNEAKKDKKPQPQKEHKNNQHNSNSSDNADQSYANASASTSTISDEAIAAATNIAAKDYSSPRRNDKRDKKPEHKDRRPANTEAPVIKKHEVKPVSEEDAAKAQQAAENFINSVLKGMNMEVTLTSAFDHANNELLVNMQGPDMGIMIGKRGQTLDSLQYLASLVVNSEHKDDYIRVKLDTEDYRKRRETTLRNLARNIAYKAKRTRKTIALEPMNPYERRIIHSALQGDKYVTTKSEGEEPFRHVVVFLKK